MGSYTNGWMGNGSSYTNMSSPQSLHITMQENEYPKGKFSLGNFGDSLARWMNPDGNFDQDYWFKLYLCDSNGNNSYWLQTIKVKGGRMNSGAKSWSVDCPNLRGKSLHMKASKSTVGNFNLRLYNRSTGIKLATAIYSFTITVEQPQAGGTVSCDVSEAKPGDSIELSNTPDTGYTFKNYTFSIETVMLDENHFYMPSGNVTVSAVFEKTLYYVATEVTPSGAGIASASPGSANAGDTVTMSQTAASGSLFVQYTGNPSVTFNSSGEFTMPASDITVTAKYARRSTATLSQSTMEAGDTVVMSIQEEFSGYAYTHKYQLSFGSGMETNVTDVPAMTRSVNISIPDSWSYAIPNQTDKTGGTLTLYTYITVNGQTSLVGTYQITGLTYHVPDTVVPVLNSSQVRPERTIDGTTYPAIDSYYVQNHCGVYVKVTASGAQGATITSIAVELEGYSGSDYNGIALTGSIEWTSKLLYIAGELKVKVTITDSRGRTYEFRVTRTVQAYSAPSGTLSVWRVDSSGDPDDFGTYAKYSLTKQYTQLGSNAITWSISCTQGTASSPGDTGDLLPNDRKTFSQLQEYVITLTIADMLETFTLTAKLPSAKFAIFVQSGGDKLGIMKVPNQQIPTGKDSTFEISATTQVYIGSMTLEDYIRSLIV